MELPANKRYFTREEIEKHTPSRKDGISFKEESQTRQLYCSYIKDMGMQLKMPQKTIASAMVLCHRFFMRQSLAKNSWQTVASSCLYLASKSEDTPRFLRDIVVLAYELQFQHDPIARQRIKDDKEVYDKQKDTVLLAERILLVNLGFDLNVELPYAPLLAAVKNLGFSHTKVVKFSWNYVNDWLWTTLYLQYKPHYLAAGSLYLAAKRVNLELPRSGADAWWMQFEVSPKVLDGVIKHMLKFDELIQKHMEELMSSPESFSSAASSHFEVEADNQIEKAAAEEKPVVQMRDESLDEASMGREVEEKTLGLKRDNKQMNIDKDGIREKLKRRKLEKLSENKASALRDDSLDEADWIEREIESVDK